MSLIKTLLLEYGDDLDLKDLNRIDREQVIYTQLKKKARSLFKPMNSGSGREVYEFKDNKVIKLAKNAKGTAQNKVECGLGNEPFLDDIVANVFYCAQNYSFLISEKAEKISKSEFKSYTGVEWDAFADYIGDYGWYLIGKREIKDLEAHEIDQENDFVYEITQLIANYDLGEVVGDLIRINSYGAVTRGNKKQVVIVDYGLDRYVWREHYL